MAVYKRSYRGYDGPYSNPVARFMVVPRYAWQRMFDSRLSIGLFVSMFFFPLFCAAMIYLHHNLDAISMLKIDVRRLIPIDADFFLAFISTQSMFGFFLTAFVGPGLVSVDLANNALPLYLCRPLTRAAYVAGKFVALAAPLSAVTWAPGLLLFGMQAQLAGPQWLAENYWVAGALTAASWLWIAVLALLTLALSAWVKWRLAVSGLLFGVFWVAAGFGHMVNRTLSTNWGSLLNIGSLLATVWAELFRVGTRHTVWARLFSVRTGEELPLWTALIGLVLILAGCVALLEKNIRGCEVVR